MEKLPVEKFFGVGKVTAEKMKRLGLHTGGDLKKLTERELIKHFGKSGRFFYKIVRGIDDRLVKPDRETKSVGAEDTFPFDLTTQEEMYVELEKIAVGVHNRLSRYQLKGKTITLKIKFHDFKQITRSKSFERGIGDLESIESAAKQLLFDTDLFNKKVRLLGIQVSNFTDFVARPHRGEEFQLKLF
jgi:DNA polymerase-4